MEQIRIIKEMREGERQRGRTGRFIRCRYCIWENVPGALSSNKGKDFQAVLTEFVKVAEPDAPDVPMPEKGKWPKSGWLYDEMGRWSVAWRIHDAQFWGVPQRRKRIAVVADFNGLSAPPILFDPQYWGETDGTEPDETVSDIGDRNGPEVPPVSESLPGHSEQSGAQGQGTPVGTESGVDGTSGYGETGHGYWQPGIQSLRAEGENRPSRPSNVVCESDGRSTDGESACGCGEEENGDSAICIQGNCIDRSDTAGCNGAGWRRGGSYTLNTIDRPAVVSFQERAGKPGGAMESLSRLNEQEPCPRSETNPSLICGNPQNPQSERVYIGDGAWHSLNANNSGGQSRDAILAFSQNQREEVRSLGDCAGSLAAETGIHQQTFVAGFDPNQGSKAGGG